MVSVKAAKSSAPSAIGFSKTSRDSPLWLTTAHRKEFARTSMPTKTSPGAIFSGINSSVAAGLRQQKVVPILFDLAQACQTEKNPAANCNTLMLSRLWRSRIKAVSISLEIF
jgi:hypothetical protein